MAQFAAAGNQGSVAAGVAAAAAANSQSNAGQSFWLRDIFGDQPVGVLSQLDPRSRNNCTWLQKYSGDIALRKCNSLFVASIISLIQRNLSDARQQGVSLTWLFVKRLVRHKIPDDSPRMPIDTSVTMFRPDGMWVAEWTTTCTLVLCLLLQKANLDFPLHVAFGYWSGQVTASEWEASGVRMPRTQAERQAFDIAAFGRTVSALNPALFRPFRASLVARYTSKLLVHPSVLVSSARTVATARVPTQDTTGTIWPNAPAGPPPPPPGPPPGASPGFGAVRTASNRTQSDRTNNGDSYDCRDCKIHHAAGKHTPAGLAQIKARYAHRDSAPRPERVCYGCGKPGHYIADCPDPHKTQLQVAIPKSDDERRAENHQIEAQLMAAANERYDLQQAEGRKRMRQEQAEQVSKAAKLKESSDKHGW